MDLRDIYRSFNPRACIFLISTQTIFQYRPYGMPVKKSHWVKHIKIISSIFSDNNREKLCKYKDLNILFWNDQYRNEEIKGKLTNFLKHRKIEIQYFQRLWDRERLYWKESLYKSVYGKNSRFKRKYLVQQQDGGVIQVLYIKNKFG